MSFIQNCPALPCHECYVKECDDYNKLTIILWSTVTNIIACWSLGVVVGLHEKKAGLVTVQVPTHARSYKCRTVYAYGVVELFFTLLFNLLQWSVRLALICCGVDH